MILRITTIAFLIAVAVLFCLLLWLDKLAGFLPIGFLYLIASTGMLLALYVSVYLLRINLNLAFPAAFVACLLLLIGALSWLNGNDFTETLRSAFLGRKDFFSMLDPYIIGHVVVYVMLLRKAFTFQ